MKTLSNRYYTPCVLACALICSAPAAFAVDEDTGKNPEVWVNMGGFSRHFARDKGYNESNLGLGVEYRTNAELSYMAGACYGPDARCLPDAARFPIGSGPRKNMSDLPGNMRS